MNDDTIVRNQQPAEDPGSVRLAIIGESPGIEEVNRAVCASGHSFSLKHWQNRQLVERDRCSWCGSKEFESSPRPFVGESGRLLDDLLGDAGMTRAKVFVGNCSMRPLSEHEKDLDHCKGGLMRLALDLEVFKPTLVLCLGGLALSAFMGEGEKISNWRGSLFEGQLGNVRHKCMAAMHPASILREPSQLALLRLDVQRAVLEAESARLDLPRRCIETPTDKNDLIGRLWAIREVGQPLGYDIEGTVAAGVTVCSLALSPTHALSIPFKRMDWSDVWPEPAQAEIMATLKGLLEDRAIPKIMHNAAYECFVHRWLHGIVIAGIEDTMLAWHVLYPELLKDLSVVASVLTRQPYWGDAGAWTNDVERDTYNAIDSCVTLEAWLSLERMLTPAHRAFYKHTKALLAPCLEMSHEGMALDGEARDAMIATIQSEVFALQGELDELGELAHPTFDEVRHKIVPSNKRAKCSTWDDLLLWAKPSMRKSL